ncbi:hypothetical protein GGR51DRAFT_36843 [Nemania sp. FL0031]|nr:hypothetical protein GGR51DRAFT_36843 [Nemania sp. FL0031]
MDSGSDMTPRRSREMVPSMPGGFPAYLDVPPTTRPRSRSRPRPAPSSDTETTYSTRTTETAYSTRTGKSNPPPLPPKPKGILKNSPNRQQERQQEQEKEQEQELERNRLATRFYRVPRPVQTHQLQVPLQPPYHSPMHSPMHSPTFYPSDNSTYGGYDGETDMNSTSSELSVNTQATSVVSSDYSDVKRSRPSIHIRHVRPVHMPATRVRARPRTRPPSEVSVSRSEVTKGPSQSSGRRTIHIQIMPNKTAPLPALPPPESQSMQLTRVPNRALVQKLEQLESDTEDLLQVRRQLTRRLDNTSEELSVRVLENKQMMRALQQERNNKELILRDLEEQRKLFDEFRSNFDWQQSVLMEAERERDSLRQARTDAEIRVMSLEKDMSDQEQKQLEQDELLQQQLAQLATTTSALEDKVMISDKKIKSLATERDHLQAISTQYQAAEELRKKLQVDLDSATTENQGLKTKITGLEANIVVLRAQITEFETTKKGLEDTLASERASKYDLEKSLLAERDGLEEKLRVEKQISVNQLLADRDEVQKQLIAEKEELETQLQTTKNQMEARLQATKDELEGRLQSTRNELETQLEAHKTEKEELQQKIDAVEAVKSDLEKQLEATGEISKELAGAKDELEKRGADWQAEKDDKQSMIDGLMTELAGAKNANVALASQRLEIERKLIEVEANLINVQTELTDLQATHKTLETDNEELKTQTGDLSQKASDLDQLQTEKTAELEKLQGEHAELDEKVKSLQADLDAARAAKATLQGEKEQMEAHVKELEDGSPIVTRLKGEIAELETQVSSLQAEADKVAALAQANADLETRANGLQGAADKVPTLEQAKAELEQANVYLEQVKTELEARIAVVQGEASIIPALKDQIERLNAQIRDTQKSDTRQNRAPSRSTSRAPSKRHGRSPSNNGGFLFVRNSSDKSGHVYITTREALAKEKEKGE